MLFDSEVFQITVLSLQVSALATFISLLIGLPFGTWLALGDFRGRSFILSIINTGMALPPVVVGLVVAIMLWRSGPLGESAFDLHTHCHHHCTDGNLRACCYGIDCCGARSVGPAPSTATSGLGASRGQMVWHLWREARLPLLAALMAGFGSVISEVGASMMVGGNIRGQTRVLTTAIVLETSKGEFGQRARAFHALAGSHLSNQSRADMDQQRGRKADWQSARVKQL